MKGAIKILIALISVACVAVAQKRRVPLDFKPVNEISIAEKANGEVSIVYVYLGDDKKTKKKHLKWANLFKIKDGERFVLFAITPKKIAAGNRFSAEIIKHLELEGEEGIVSGKLPIENGEVVLSGKTWIIGEIPTVKGCAPL